MVSTKFASLVGPLTLALALAVTLHPVRTAPVNVRRQDTTAPAPAGYISVAQPDMTEQDIYAIGIPPDPTPVTSGAALAASVPSSATDPLQQVLQAAAQGALSASNNTMQAANNYDATPPVTAPVTAAPVTTPVMTAADAPLTGNPDDGDAYRQIVAQQMQQFGSSAPQKRNGEALGVGVPTPVSATMAGAGDALDSAAAATTDASATSASDVAGIPVAPPVPSDYSSPANDAVPAVSPSDLPTSAVPAAPTSDLLTSVVPTAVASDFASSAVPTSLPSDMASDVASATSVPAVPSVSAAAVPSLDAAAASAVTVLPTSNTAAPTQPAATPTGDLTMTVTLPTKALPTSLAAGVSADSQDDGLDDWKTMTILVPAEAFGGGAQTQINLPIPTTSASASASSSIASASVQTNIAAVTSAIPTTSASPTAAPINLSSLSTMAPAATNLLTIPLTGVIDGTTYSTMLTLTIPNLAASATSAASAIATSAVSVSATDKAQSATPSASASVSATPAPTKTASVSASAAATSSVDPSFINPDDIPPLLRSSMTASATSAPTATPTNAAGTADDGQGDDEDCDEDGQDGQDGQDGAPGADGRSLLTKVWDWMTGKPLQERDWDEGYDYEYEDGSDDGEVYYDAQ